MKAPRIRVLAVITTLTLDGPGRVLHGIFRHVDRSRFECGVCALLTKAQDAHWGDGRALLDQEGVKVFDMGLRKPWDLFCMPALVKVMRRFKPDIVHTHCVRGDVFGRLAASVAGVSSVVSTIHGTDDWKRSPSLLCRAALAADGATQRLADCLVCVSQDVLRDTIYLQGRRNCRYQVIHNGIDPTFPQPGKSRELESLTGWGEDTVKILFCGRLDANKNVALLLRAFGLLAGKHGPRVRLALLGDGPERQALARQCAALGIAEEVFFAGHCRQVRPLLSGGDIYVMPSRHEGFSLALLEAMDAALPAVVTNVPGLREAVVDGQNGLRVRLDDPQAMADAMNVLVEDAPMRRKMGQAARETFLRRFTAEHMSRRYQELYLQLGQER